MKRKHPRKINLLLHLDGSNPNSKEYKDQYNLLLKELESIKRSVIVNTSKLHIKYT